MQNCTQRN